MNDNNKEQNIQEYYNTIMNKNLAERIVNLRDEDKVSWKDLSSIIKKEFGDEYALEENVITSMYLEYSARDYLDK